MRMRITTYSVSLNGLHILSPERYESANNRIIDQRVSKSAFVSYRFDYVISSIECNQKLPCYSYHNNDSFIYILKRIL